jgi:hypothetical protein
MRKNTKEKKNVFINFYKLNDQGQIVYAYGDKAGIVASLNEGTMYEITKSELANFTDCIFAKNAWADARQYNVYYADRTTIALVGKNGTEFAAGLAYVLEKGVEAFACDDANKWCTGIHVMF